MISLVVLIPLCFPASAAPAIVVTVMKVTKAIEFILIGITSADIPRRQAKQRAAPFTRLRGRTVLNAMLRSCEDR
jgi:hypothetical protein